MALAEKGGERSAAENEAFAACVAAVRAGQAVSVPELRVATEFAVENGVPAARILRGVEFVAERAPKAVSPALAARRRHLQRRMEEREYARMMDRPENDAADEASMGANMQIATGGSVFVVLISAFLAGFFALEVVLETDRRTVRGFGGRPWRCGGRGRHTGPHSRAAPQALIGGLVASVAGLLVEVILVMARHRKMEDMVAMRRRKADRAKRERVRARRAQGKGPAKRARDGEQGSPTRAGEGGGGGEERGRG